MPLIGDSITLETRRIPGSNFSFSGARIDDLGATEYSLVTIAVDVTGSTCGFAKELRDALIAAVESCKKSPRSENLLLRVIIFSTMFVGGVKELHGFTPLAQINSADYPDFNPDGLTPLFDATFSAVGAMIEYGKDLMDNDFLTNAIAFIITDGGDNSSTETAKSVAKKIASVKDKELLESLVTILIGINTKNCSSELRRFHVDGGLDQYIDAGDVTKGKLAKLANFVSQSISSTSQALGTGGPSQQISASI